MLCLQVKDAVENGIVTFSNASCSVAGVLALARGSQVLLLDLAACVTDILEAGELCENAVPCIQGLLHDAWIF